MAPKEAGVKKPRAKPTHPPYADIIKEAISSLKERDGSSLQAITKYVAAKYPNLQGSWKKQLSLQLRRLTEQGKLVKVKASWKLGDALKKKPAAPKKPKAASGTTTKKPATKKPAAAKPKTPKAKKEGAAKTTKVAKPKAAKPKTPKAKKPAAAKPKSATKKPAAAKKPKAAAAKKPAAKKPAAKKAAAKPKKAAAPKKA